MNAHRDEPATKKDLDQVKQELTDKIDANGKKIDANGKKIDANSAKIDANGRKIDANSAKIDRLTVYAIENRERLDKMLTEEKFKVYFSELMNNIDGLAKIVSRGEQERITATAWIRRVEGDVETNKSEIKKIKTKLAMDT